MFDALAVARKPHLDGVEQILIAEWFGEKLQRAALALTPPALRLPLPKKHFGSSGVFTPHV